jgi:dTDP-4-dehydrorhamnose 3,5-epimerase
LKVDRLAIPEVLLIVPRRFGDARGFFAETYTAKKFAEIGIDRPFVQDNQSLSRVKGTVRGLHCQIAPHTQGKLIRVGHGAAWDVAVDIRAGSASYGKWVAARLTAEAGEQLWVPPGFLHGFTTLTPDTEILYKVTADYDPRTERGVIWNDPSLGISWPIEGEPILSDKDKILPPFAAVRDWFAV